MRSLLEIRLAVSPEFSWFSIVMSGTVAGQYQAALGKPLGAFEDQKRLFFLDMDGSSKNGLHKIVHVYNVGKAKISHSLNQNKWMV